MTANAPGNVGVCVTAAAPARLRAAEAWLGQRDRARPLLIVAPTQQAASDLVYRVLDPDVAAAGAAAAAGEPPGPVSGAAAVFGWHRVTLARLAGALATPALVARNLVPVGRLGTQAAITRAIDLLRSREALGRYARVAAMPGFSRALAATLEELRLAGVSAGRLQALDAPLAAAADTLAAVLQDAGLVDWPGVLECAAGLLESSDYDHELAGLPTLVLDPALDSPAERRFLRALLTRAGEALVTLPEALDGEAPAAWLAPLAPYGVHARQSAAARGAAVPSDGARLLERLQTGLFVPAGASRGQASPPPPQHPAATDAPQPPGTAPEPPAETPQPATLDLFSTPAPAPDRETPAAALRVFSAPGESRECVEIVRAIRDHAAAGVPFDQMAVLLRAPEQYRPHLEEAFQRADIPAWFARGAVRPDPAGRAFVALLRCREAQYSAHRFAEYLSLGEVPPVERAAGAPPPAPPADERWIAPDPEVTAIPGVAADVQAAALRDGDAAAPAAAGPPPPGGGPGTGSEGGASTGGPADGAGVQDGNLRAPRRWEQLLHEAAVIGGFERWARRLDGLDAQLRRARETLENEADEVRLAAVERDIADLAHLRAFALPLVADLAALPASAPWGEWLDALSALATRALRTPQRVLAVLSELRPMAAVGPVGLDEVILVLAPRLRELAEPPPASRYGRVFVAPVEAVRGHAFDVVFVPGLAEKLFPQKISEDPILLDEQRRVLDDALETNDARVGRERMALRLAVGAARHEVVLSYPRIDMEQGRPRVASFYSLEAIRAAEGRMLDFQALASRAELETRARIGWPAPADARDAIDEAEHDLAVLDSLLQLDEEEAVGAARYLLGVNAHLARALRFRARRWLRGWTQADGLVGPLREPAARALASHAFSERTYSPTALQNYAQCPYRFLLYAIHKLAPREVPAAIDEMDPLQRGSLVHDVQFHLLTRLRGEGLLPVAEDGLARAQAMLDEVLDEVAARYHDLLAPAIERVWEDGIAGIRADLREWLRRMSEDRSGWVPWAFELAFGLPDVAERDSRSVPEGVPLDCGIRLRGSIDLIERREDGSLRVTDHKTGRKAAEAGQIIGGGEHLQPVLYAQAAARLFAEQGSVISGRLYYCTAKGDFAEHEVPFNDEAQLAAQRVAETIGEAMARQFLPAAPGHRRWSACEYCEYRIVCGPWEEERVRRKRQDELAPLFRLRDTR